MVDLANGHIEFIYPGLMFAKIGGGGTMGKAPFFSFSLILVFSYPSDLRSTCSSFFFLFPSSYFLPLFHQSLHFSLSLPLLLSLRYFPFLLFLILFLLRLFFTSPMLFLFLHLLLSLFLIHPLLFFNLPPLLYLFPLFISDPLSGAEETALINTTKSVL